MKGPARSRPYPNASYTCDQRVQELVDASHESREFSLIRILFGGVLALFFAFSFTGQAWFLEGSIACVVAAFCTGCLIIRNRNRLRCSSCAGAWKVQQTGGRWNAKEEYLLCRRCKKYVFMRRVLFR